MDPYLGPVAGALLAALGAGVALGVVRLHRVSLAWWRRRAAGPPAAAEAAIAAGAEEQAIDPAVAPPVFAPLGAIAALALVVAGLALIGGAGRPEAVPRPLVVPPLAPASLAALAARASSIVGFGVLAVLVTAGCAILVSALDQAVERGIAHLARRARRGRAEETPPELSVPDVVATARTLLPGAPAPVRGEPFGVGLAYVGIFAAATLGVGALLAAIVARATAPEGFVILMSGTRGWAPPPAAFAAPAALAALALLATPAFYAAAAERSRDPLRARLRRDAAVRQLAVAPVWLVAGAVLVGARDAPLPVPAWLVAFVALVLFVVAAAAALPGAGAGPGAWNAPPRGGDRAEPAAAVRALTAIAHHAWIVVAAVLPFVVRSEDRGVPFAAFAWGALALLLFLGARAALRRRMPADVPSGETP